MDANRRNDLSGLQGNKDQAIYVYDKRRRTLSPWVGKAKLEHINEIRRHHNRWA